MPSLLDDFDAACADRLAAWIATAGDLLKIGKDKKEWMARVVWTIGQVPAIATEAECEGRQLQLLRILETNVGRRFEPAAVAAFLNTGEGALALALLCRITAWEKRFAH